MSDHFITEIYIEKIRHLKNIKIDLSNDEAKHLILTGKNGVGKTTLVEAIKEYLNFIIPNSAIKGQIRRLLEKNSNNGSTKLPDNLNLDLDNFYDLNIEHSSDLDIKFNCEKNLLKDLYSKGNFILAYYPSNRATNFEMPSGVEKINLKDTYTFDEKPSEVFLKY